MAGTYSKAYQTVVAGVIREDESLAFFKDNEIATPARVTSFNNVGGKVEPTLVTAHLDHVGIGKTGTTSDNISAYNPAAVNIT